MPRADKPLVDRFREHDAAGKPRRKRRRSARVPPLDAALHFTDRGNARRVVERHGQDLHYVFPWKAWLVYDGRRWAEDATGEVVRRVKETQDSILREAVERMAELQNANGDMEAAAERERQKELLTHVIRWEDARAIARCLELAKSEECVPVLPGQLDHDPFLLNVLNGTLELRTGELRPHGREDRITKLARINYDPAARCPGWEKFLSTIMNGNDDLVTYLQRVVGYGLTGDVSEQCLWFFYGTGANGKSTFLGTVLAMLGDYGMQAVSDLLMVKNHESHPTERADLFGKRFVATIETEEGKRMAEALMKQMTGGDKVRARKMRQDFFEFTATHKIVLAANHKPTVRGTDHAVWRRIKLVPFTVTIGDDKKDKALPAKLKKELPGILAWAVRGCRDWQQHGLGEPEEVTAATDSYRAEQDLVQAFIDDCCCAHRDLCVKASAFLDAYHDYSGDRLMTRQTFAQRLREKGFESKRHHGGSTFWHGVSLREDSESEGRG
jgi:putative DNA primase/helicase